MNHHMKYFEISGSLNHLGTGICSQTSKRLGCILQRGPTGPVSTANMLSHHDSPTSVGEITRRWGRRRRRKEEVGTMERNWLPTHTPALGMSSQGCWVSLSLLTVRPYCTKTLAARHGLAAPNSGKHGEYFCLPGQVR